MRQLQDAAAESEELPKSDGRPAKKWKSRRYPNVLLRGFSGLRACRTITGSACMRVWARVHARVGVPVCLSLTHKALPEAAKNKAFLKN